MKVYLDNGATTKVDPQVVKAMLPYYSDKYGNASSLHSFGREASKALEESRAIIAKAINAEPEEIFFTSGGTESDNFAIKKIAHSNREKGNHIITSKIEHPAVLNSCKFLESKGFKVTYLAVDKEGFIDLKQLEKSITPQTILVSIMHANNEIGTIQDIEKIGAVCKKHKVYFHTDAVQSFTKVPIDVKKMNIDLASFSAHKLHGPKGIGALYIRKGTNIQPMMHGGSQERKMRAGTENVASAAGFAKAVSLVNRKELAQIQKLRDYLIKKVLSGIPNSKLNGSKTKRLANNANIAFKYVEGEAMLIRMDLAGIAVSTGSACSSKSLQPSHVLLAIGMDPAEAHGTLRFTLSKFTTKKEADYAVGKLEKIIKDLRSISPLRKGVEYEIRDLPAHEH